MIYQAVIIGGGPSGLMAAIELEKQNTKYILLEKNEVVAKKLFLSGGQRCNVTNNLDIDEFIENLTLRNKKFLYPSMYTMSTYQVIEFFKENNLELTLENNFKYFPKTGKSQSIIDVLLGNINNTNIITSCTVNKVIKNDQLFTIETSKGVFKTNNVIISTGSKSFPVTGSTGFGLKVAKKFNLKYEEFTPAETHVYSNQVKNYLTDLMGTSIEDITVRVKNSKTKYKGDLLFTHFGLSGPVIYHLSEFIYEELQKKPVTLEFALTKTSEQELEHLLNESNSYLLKILEKVVTKRLARKILDILSIDNKRVVEISKKEISLIKDTLLRFNVKVTRVEDKEKAYVNKGGVSLTEINPNTLESKKIEGLYFTGETLNIHGPIGGYNITIAFATGKLAALAIIEK